ncbi:MAG: hypothetical protein KIB00_16825 [Paeniclostridium sordellii]|nr:hypothetical protein [Paeniclostridium sordellii]
MTKIELKRRVSCLAIELLKMFAIVFIAFIVGFPLMIKGFEWFAGLFGYTL